MKKILSVVAIATIMSTSLLAVDVSVDTSQSEKVDTDSSTSYKYGKDMKKTEGIRESQTSTSDKSHSTSTELSLSGQVEVLEAIKSAESRGIYPFSQCSVLSNPKLVADFGLTSEDEDGSIDTILADILQKAATNNASIVSAGADEYAIKDYINCVSFYGAIVADSLKYDSFSPTIRDEKIKKTFENIQKDLANSKCRFDKSTDAIVCRSIKLKIDYEPAISYANIAIYSNQTYFGYSASNKVSDSKTRRLAFEAQKSKERARTKSLNQDVSFASKETISQDIATKTNFSPRNWLPK